MCEIAIDCILSLWTVSCEFLNHVFDVDFWNPHLRMMLFGSRFWCHVPLLRSFLICETDIKYHIRQNSNKIVVLTKRNAQKVHIANLACVTVGGLTLTVHYSCYIHFIADVTDVTLFIAGLSRVCRGALLLPLIYMNKLLLETPLLSLITDPLQCCEIFHVIILSWWIVLCSIIIVWLSTLTLPWLKFCTNQMYGRSRVLYQPLVVATSVCRKLQIWQTDRQVWQSDGSVLTSCLIFLYWRAWLYFV